jgi:hypothetical protein
MNEAAKAAENGEVEDRGLSKERSLEFVQAMAADREEGIDSLDPETRAVLRDEPLELLKKGFPRQLAAEAWGLHQALEPPANIARFLARSMPPGTVDPMAAATEILRESLGIEVPVTPSGADGT